MSEEKERAPAIMDAHQDLVRHIEQSATRMRLLSAVTMVVGGVLAFAYITQLLLPLMGTATVTVNLSDPANVAVELIVLGLALLWLFVGAQDLRFSWRMEREIGTARAKEKEIEDRIA